MRRITTSTRAVDLFGAGKDGFKDGDLANGIVPTDLNADIFNQLQEEVARIIESAGVPLDGAVFTQLTRAVKRLFGGNVTTVNAANSPYALTADHAGLVIMDATAGNVSATLPAAALLTGVSMKYRFVRVDATVNTATVSRAGADTFVGGATSFTFGSLGDWRVVESDTVSKWAFVGRRAKSTRTVLTSGSGTYTTPAGCVALRVRGVGGGGGGAGSGSSAGTAASVGGNTTFGTALLVANGGGIGNLNAPSGVGGTGSIGGAVGFGIAGAVGQGSGVSNSGGNAPPGGTGGGTALGGGGGGGQYTHVGASAPANSGAGGGGGGGVGPGFGGGGGSAGYYFDAVIDAPAVSYAYAVGAGGTAGGAGPGGYQAGNGGDGILIIDELY